MASNSRTCLGTATCERPCGADIYSSALATCTVSSIGSPNHPWTNGQLERMNRALKEATVRRYHHGCDQQLRQPSAKTKAICQELWRATSLGARA